MQNGFYESFNGRMRDELLNKSQFFGLDHARDVAGVWADVFNKARPHSSLGYRTPAAYAATLTTTGARLRNPDQLLRAPVAHAAPQGASTAEALNRRRLKVRWQVTSASSARRSTDIRRASALFVGRLATQHTARRNSTA
jgi:hypothetical protein